MHRSMELTLKSKALVSCCVSPVSRPHLIAWEAMSQCWPLCAQGHMALDGQKPGCGPSTHQEGLRSPPPLPTPTFSILIQLLLFKNETTALDFENRSLRTFLPLIRLSQLFILHSEKGSLEFTQRTGESPELTEFLATDRVCLSLHLVLSKCSSCSEHTGFGVERFGYELGHTVT